MAYGYQPRPEPAFGGPPPIVPPPFGFGPAPPFGAFGPPGYGGVMYSPLDDEIQTVLREIHSELQMMDQSADCSERFKNARRLLATEAARLENSVDPEWLEVDLPKPIKVVKKVLIPIFRYQKFNFVGKVLGPKGTTLQNIAKTYKCHVEVLGRGSTRDRAKEQELLNTGDPQYAHFGRPLHIQVESSAPPAVAYERVNGVLGVLSQLLQPIKDTHIEGITTEQYPPQEGAAGTSNNNNGNDGSAGSLWQNAGGGPMKGGYGLAPAFFGSLRGGGGFQPRGGRGAGGGFQKRGGFGGGGGFGASHGGWGRGGPRGAGGYQPY